MLSTIIVRETWWVETLKTSWNDHLNYKRHFIIGKTTKTVDPDLEDQIERLRDTQRKYSNILRLSKTLSGHLYNMVQTQVRSPSKYLLAKYLYQTFQSSLGSVFSDLAHKSPELQQEFTLNAESQRNLTKNGQHLLASLNFFVSRLVLHIKMSCWQGCPS